VRLAFRAPNWLGDAILATVVPPALRRAHAGARIDVVVPAGIADVYRRAESVDDVVPFAAGGEVDAYRGRRYDGVLLGPTSFGSAWRARRGTSGDLFGFATSGRGFLLAGKLAGRELRRDRHQVENYRALAALLGSPRPDDAPQVALDATWRAEAEAAWAGRPRPRVVLHAGATYGPAKRWSADRFAEVARRLAAQGATVAVVGGPGDAAAVKVVREGASVTDLSGRTSVGVLAAVLEAADVVVTNDTGPMHLAAAVGTPVVAVFGSTSPEWTGPWGDGHRVVRHPVPCAPCFRRDCRIGYLCLEGIPAARVLEAASGVLERRGAVAP